MFVAINQRKKTILFHFIASKWIDYLFNFASRSLLTPCIFELTYWAYLNLPTVHICTYCTYLNFNVHNMYVQENTDMYSSLYVNTVHVMNLPPVHFCTCPPCKSAITYIHYSSILILQHLMFRPGYLIIWNIFIWVIKPVVVKKLAAFSSIILWPYSTKKELPPCSKPKVSQWRVSI